MGIFDKLLGKSTTQRNTTPPSYPQNDFITSLGASQSVAHAHILFLTIQDRSFRSYCRTLVAHGMTLPITALGLPDTDQTWRFWGMMTAVGAELASRYQLFNPDISDYQKMIMENSFQRLAQSTMANIPTAFGLTFVLPQNESSWQAWALLTDSGLNLAAKYDIKHKTGLD